MRRAGSVFYHATYVLKFSTHATEQHNSREIVMSVCAEFHFDFGSPNAYLAHKVLPSITARTGIAFVYVPVLLGGVFKATNNAPPMVQFQGVRNKNEYAQLEMQRFITQHQIPFALNPHFPVNTITIMRGAVAAEMDGIVEAYVDAVFDLMWKTPKKLDDPAITKAALDEAGFDGTAILARTQDQAVKERLLENTEASVDRGTFGSPTFYVNGEIYFGKDRLAEVEQAIIAAKG
jgi:2-hydroxychromene-2-carboxylate isomerase